MGNLGRQMYELLEELFPIPRSITGDGVRKTLEIIKRKHLPELKIKSLRSGERCFDWTVPDEWHIEEAYIEDLETGERVVDWRENSLHVVGYSVAVDKVVSFEELREHVFFREDMPNAIPYVTSYYSPFWGFCLTYDQFRKLNPKGRFRVVIRSKHFKGHLNYGELVIQGAERKEIFFSTYICHPSLANDNLSGPVLATFLAKYISSKENRRYTYRFVFVPETIGSICYLSRNLEHLKRNVIAGFVLTCVGDEGKFSYLPSRQGDTLADRAALCVLENCVGDFVRYTYMDRGSDERQYCWPGIDLPVCLVMKTKFGKFREYHTSLDNLSFVTPKGLEESYELYTKIIDLLENNYVYRSRVLCEPFLSKRNLYPKISSWKSSYSLPKTLINILAYSDGSNDLISLANTLKVCPSTLLELVNILFKEELLEKLDLKL